VVKKQSLRHSFNPGDIRFWILVFFLIRLVGITNPPLEIAHSWRMVTTNMYARNFLEIDNNILYARVDMAGELSGITAKEFPIYNYLIYLISLVFGWQDWYGRLISLLVSSLGTWYYFLLVKRFVGERHAFFSTLVLMSSIWFAYSRKIMPDTFSMSLVLASFYYGICYLYSGKGYRLTLYLLLGMAGTLSKIPSSYVFVLFLVPFLDHGVKIRRKTWVLAASIVVIAVNGIWYLYWVPEVTSTYGFIHYPEKSFLEGTREISQNFGDFLKRFYESALMSYVSFAIFLGGLVLLVIRKEKKILMVFAVLLVVFLVFTLKAGRSFTWHNYYIVPFVPAMALVSGYLLSALGKRWIYVTLLVIIATEGIANQQHEFFIPGREKYKLDLQVMADSVCGNDDLVAVSGGHNPQQLYFMHRRGWALKDEEIDEPDKVRDFQKRGARFLFINKESKIERFEGYPVIYENAHYIVYDLH
jgi:hypothetical protein